MVFVATLSNVTNRQPAVYHEPSSSIKHQSPHFLIIINHHPHSCCSFQSMIVINRVHTDAHSLSDCSSSVNTQAPSNDAPARCSGINNYTSNHSLCTILIGSSSQHDQSDHVGAARTAAGFNPQFPASSSWVTTVGATQGVVTSCCSASTESPSSCLMSAGMLYPCSEEREPAVKHR